jgi:pimeloyl-ACP methyl ester carboxylesterase/limonene-1,2-epoxide hydrolase
VPTLNLSAGVVHYIEQGQGVPLVLLHANPGDSRDFEAVIPALARNYRVLALDWPGYGKSDLPRRSEAADVMLFYKVLKDFLAALSLPPAFFIGNSVGGNAAARLAAEAPASVRGLVLVAPGGFTPHNFITRMFCKLQGSRFSLPPRLFASLYLKHRTPTVRGMLHRAATVQSEAAPHRSQSCDVAQLRPTGKRSSANRSAHPGAYAPAIRHARSRNPGWQRRQGGRALYPIGEIRCAAVRTRLFRRNSGAVPGGSSTVSRHLRQRVISIAAHSGHHKLTRNGPEDIRAKNFGAHKRKTVSRTPEEIVRAFCANISDRNIATIEPLLADDIVFMNVGLEIYRGKQAVLNHFNGPKGVWDMFPDTFEFRIRNLGVTDNRVYTERVDIVGVDGHDARLPLLGIFEIENGKIKHWRDYSDMAMVRRLLKGEIVTPEEGFPPGTDDV